MLATETNYWLQKLKLMTNVFVMMRKYQIK